MVSLFDVKKYQKMTKMRCRLPYKKISKNAKNIQWTLISPKLPRMFPKLQWIDLVNPHKKGQDREDLSLCLHFLK